jgi:ATP-dependent Lhr-like helicase
MEGTAAFHPVLRQWFAKRFPGGPTDAQRLGWPAIARGRDTLIAAPTGTGKTLAAFLVQIDRLLREGEAAGGLEERIDVVYVSPLKALAADVRANLEAPLDEIRALAAELGHAAPEIRVQTRSGDTAGPARAAMLRRPPHILVTTPESLYLMVTAEQSRERLRRVRTVIVDEIHAVARDKRGAHLALTLERLEALCASRPVRIGLSATQRPIETVARLLVGAGAERSDATGRPLCEVVDLGHARELDLAIEVPGSELEAVTSHEQWDEILGRVAEGVRAHRTTLVFVNTRRLAERLAHQLGEKLEPDAGAGRGAGAADALVAAHHGSLSKERRQRIEARLRAGELRCLVATASLELGIDVGPVELVCQIGSPRSLGTCLQRVGRSGHALGATPKGRLFPTTRDELVECAALVRGLRAGELDRVRPPRAPLDILAQQIVAACAAESWREDALYALVRRAAPYGELARAEFDEAVELLSSGIQTGRGRRAAWLHRDRVHGSVRARRGARIAALTSGGAIPDRADYRVVADPDDTFVGTVDEDWAIESMQGDVFLLGSTSWKIRRVEPGRVRVIDARGAPPTVPFWLGEAPARTAELSQEVSRLRADVAARLGPDGAEDAVAWLAAETGTPRGGAEQVVRYLAATRAALGVVPSQRDVVYERFFDETGGMQLVVHAPYGGRINRALGLALRKRFCRAFDFELQAAASDDAVVLSLGPQHAFPLADVARFLGSASVREVLAQALLATPLWAARWRWNLGRALAVPRTRGGRKLAPPIQRMEAEDLMAAVFPSLAACQENATGPIEIPDHLLVRQTLRDCLEEATDADGLECFLRACEAGAVRLHFVDSAEPSPLAHEILNGRPYTFLDDAPLEERRTRAVATRRGLPATLRELGRLDPEAIARVREEAAPAPRDADELHDVLLAHGVSRPERAWLADFEALVRAGRAARLETPAGPFWVATERRACAEALFPGARFEPDVRLPALAGVPEPESEEHAAADVLRGHLDGAGPLGLRELAARTGLAPATLECAIARLEAEGSLFRGRFTPAAGAEEYCARRLLARIQSYTQERLRREIEPVTAQEYARFLLRWQHVAPGTQREGRRGLRAVLAQLQGLELAAAEWEGSVLPARVAGYRPEWLDELCLSGEVVWARLAPGAETAAGDAAAAERGRAAPSRATPVSLALRSELPWLLRAARGSAAAAPPVAGAARQVFERLAARGALFAGDLAAQCGLARREVEAALWDLVSRGLVTADGFGALRALLAGRERGRRRGPRGDARRGDGRLALLPDPAAEIDRDTLAERVAAQLAARWGVVFYDLLARETLALPWREIVHALRRLEARAVLRGGRFVSGFVGEQYAAPEAVDALRRVRRQPRSAETLRVSAADPLNLVGILQPGPRVPARAGRSIVYHDGRASDPDAAARFEPIAG